MMRVAREPDPHMYPALKKLRQYCDTSGGKLIMAALSNTSIFPADHPWSAPDSPEMKDTRELRALFDLFISSAHLGMR